MTKLFLGVEPHAPNGLSTLATIVTELGDNLSPNSATVAEFGDSGRFGGSRRFGDSRQIRR